MVSTLNQLVGCRRWPVVGGGQWSVVAGRWLVWLDEMWVALLVLGGGGRGGGGGAGLRSVPFPGAYVISLILHPPHTYLHW
jgi:hypothetical protein